MFALFFAMVFGGVTSSFCAEAPSSESMSNVETRSEVNESPLNTSPVRINYFGIFYGPGLKSPTSYQPDLTGQPDKSRPVLVKNFATASYAISENIGIAGSFFWTWQPVMDHAVILQDPFIRVSHNSLIQYENFNLYGDMRLHFPASSLSRSSHQRLGVQAFQAATYEFLNSRFIAGTYVSERVNFIGQGGYGTDAEFYLAPNLSYQISPKVAFSILFEMFASHSYGEKLTALNNDGTDLEPGIVWDITPDIMVNPYLNILTGGNINLKTTSIGMMVSVNLI